MGESVQLIRETTAIDLTVAADGSGALVLCDGDLLIVDVDVAARRLLTRRHDQLVGQPFLRFLDPDDVDPIDEIVHHLRVGGLGSATVDLSIAPLYGKPVPVALTVTNLGRRSSVGNSGGEGSVLLVLSPLRRTGLDPEPRALPVSASDERSFELTTRLLLWPEPAFDHVSASCEELLGYPAKAFYAKPSLLLELVEDPREAELLQQVYRGWEPHEPLILHLTHRQGHTVVLEQHTRGRRDGSGELLALESFAIDVTEREEERARYVTAATATRRLDEMAGVHLEAVEPAVVVEAAIDAVCTHLGWSLGHAFLIDDSAGHLVSGPWFDADPERSAPLRAATDGGCPSIHGDLVSEALILVEQVVVDLPDADRTPRSLAAAASGYRYAVTVPIVLDDELGAVLEFFVDGPVRPSPGVVAGVADVAEELGRALGRTHAVRHLRELDQARQEFVAKAAHELRGPIGSISLMAAALARQARASDQGPIAASLDSLVLQAERIQAMATRLLELSQLDEGRVRLVPQALPVDAALAAAMSARPASSIRAVTEVEDGLVVYADATLFDAIVSNLLANAERHATSRIEIDATADGDGIRLSVSDDGLGVAPDLVPDLFQPLRSTLATPDRSGLGLALVHRMATSMGGRVAYEAVEPHGARFVVTLPAAGPG